MSSQALRIAIDGRPALRPRTGTGTITHHVLERIQSVDSSNEYLAYFDRDPGEAARAYAGMTCRFGGPRQSFAWSNSWLLKQLHCDKVDAYITFAENDVPLAPTRAKIVTMIDDVTPLRFPEMAFRSSLHDAYSKSRVKLAAQRSDLVLTNSVYAKNEILRGLKVDESKVVQIPLGVRQTGAISPLQTAAVLQRYRLERPFVMALGSTEPRKNNAAVLQAMKLLGHKHPRLKLAVAGRAWRGMQFDPGLLSEGVRLLGNVSEKDLPVMMAAAEMLVFPSLHEGFGFPVLEAMAMGVPVVTSPVGGLSEVGGDAVLYADPHNPAEIASHMDQVLSDGELAGELRSKGRERAGLFRWTETCSAIADLCEGLMEKREWRTQAVTQ